MEQNNTLSQKTLPWETHGWFDTASRTAEEVVLRLGQVDCSGNNPKDIVKDSGHSVT